MATEVFDVSSPRAWGDPRFRKMLLAGLARDGAPSHIVELIGDWMDEKKPRSYAEFSSLVTQRSSTLPTEQREACEAVQSRLTQDVEFTSSCYLRDSPEKARVIQWPNNPATKAKLPENHFDIREDFFFRVPHRFITPQTPIGSAGSCFALRIAHQLQLWGYNFVLEEDDLPPDVPLEQLSSTSYRMSSARCGTLFNVPSMRQMVERAFGLWTPERIIVRDGSRIIDPFRATKAAYVDEAGFERDYHAHTSALRRALLRCDVFILTLGLTEAWQLAHSGAYTSLSAWKVDPVLLRHKTLSVSENVDELERLYEVYRQHRAGIKLIVSVSPVPLQKTFSPTKHVVEANTLSKATLRVAADEFCSRHPDTVFYLPAYEMVMSGCRQPWEEDMRHVSPEALSRVMGLFQRMFLEEQTPLPGTSLETTEDWRDPQHGDVAARNPLSSIRSFAARLLRRA